MRTFILILCATILGPQSSHAFQSDHSAVWLKFLSQQPHQYSYSMSLDGLIKFNQYPKRDNTNYLATEFYLHPTIIVELDLSLENQAMIKKAFGQSRDDWEEKLLDAASEDPDNRLESLKKARESLHRELTKRIDSALSDRQRKQLGQIQLRFLIHQNGFYQTLNHQVVQALLDLPSLDAETFGEFQRKLSRDILDQNIAISAEAISILLADFSDEQRKVFDDRWGRLFKFGATEQLMIQLNPNMQPTKFDPKSPFDISSNWPEFVHDAAGNCELKNGADPSGFGLQTSAELRKLAWMQSFFSSSHFRRDIEIVELQIEQFKELTIQFHQIRMSASAKIGEKYGIQPRITQVTNLNGEREIRAFYKLTETKQFEEYEEEIADEARVYRQKYMDVLLPHQIDVLNTVVGNMNTRLQGPLAELLWGDLGRVLELDESAKESLREKSNQAREFLEAESKQVYDDAMDQLIEFAPKNEQARLRLCLGDGFKSISPNLVGFAVGLLHDGFE